MSFLAAARLLIRIFGAHGESDSAARRELRGHDGLAGRARFDEIVENAVGHCFVERALVAIRGEIKLERFALDAETIGRVIDIDPGEIGLAGDRANGSEIVRFKMNPVIAVRRRIRKSLESRLGGRSGKFRFASAEKR